jgi:hypothetical protein
MRGPVGGGCEAVAGLGGLTYFRGVYSFTTVTDIIGKHHDGLAIPKNIHKPVAVQRTIEYFNFGTFWNHDRDFGVNWPVRLADENAVKMVIKGKSFGQKRTALH